ncbi:MAG: hypothetical protein KC444_06940 [Nitrosopumilus sp.]|nr:hypothetical protein [Nitrosopumilus sp.]
MNNTLFLIPLLALSITFAFADNIVTIPEGSSVPDCEKTIEGCYNPLEITIQQGESITWENKDTAFHTVTSVTSTGKIDGVFDSGFMNTGKTWSYKFEESGTFSYFCSLHPWMVGNVIVNSKPIIMDDTITN